jgi:hypothetical protein
MATPLKTFALKPSKAPNLLVAPSDYDQQSQSQLLNALRLYFNQIDNFTQPLSTSSGGSYIQFPYAAISSSVTQTTTTNTAKALTFNTNDFLNGFIVVSSSKITATYAGIYNLQFSVQLQSNSTATEDVYIWLRQNGNDITGSTGFIGMLPRKSAGNPSHDIKGWNYFVNLNANDYIELWWSTSNGTDVTIPFYAASGTPTKPSTQSVVATMQFVSAQY